jgi:hypothetical protein
MHVTKEGAVVGSIDRAALAGVKAKDEDAKATLEQLQAEHVPSSEPAEEAEPDKPGADEQPKPSMALSKEELVELARGKVDDPENKTKAELVEALGGKA